MQSRALESYYMCNAVQNYRTWPLFQCSSGLLNLLTFYAVQDSRIVLCISLQFRTVELCDMIQVVSGLLYLSNAGRGYQTLPYHMFQCSSGLLNLAAHLNAVHDHRTLISSYAGQNCRT